MKLLAMFICSIAIGQAAQSSSPGAGSSVRINVYRYKGMFGKAIRPSIYVDDVDVARLQDGRFVTLALAPGKHAFTSNDKQASVELDLKRGQEYFLRIDMAPGVLKGHGRLTLVQAEQGTSELKKMKPADADMIKTDKVLAPDFKPEKGQR